MSGEAASSHLTAISSQECHSEYYDQRGEWQPLSVWHTRGYDVRAIESKSTAANRKDHPVFGKVYRVVMEVDGNKGHRSIKTEETMKASKPVKVPEASAGPLAIMDGSPGSISSKSSSSSSSSSAKRKKDKKRKSKKGKKGKKDKKDKKHRKHHHDGKEDSSLHTSIACSASSPSSAT
jgi:hypothetical protein